MYKLIVCLVMIGLNINVYGQDWPNLGRYKEANAALGLPKQGEKRVVFLGNSITEGWHTFFSDFFTNGYVNRGIGGQTTPQMLVCFRQDVIELKPEVVVILAGTNDLVGNTGLSNPVMIMDNLISMEELARANRIQVVLCSVLPVLDYPWNPGKKPAEKIITLNKMIKAYAQSNDCIYLDYFSLKVDEKKGMKNAYSEDGVHPNKEGYQVMMSLFRTMI